MAGSDVKSSWSARLGRGRNYDIQSEEPLVPPASSSPESPEPKRSIFRLKRTWFGIGVALVLISALGADLPQKRPSDDEIRAQWAAAVNENAAIAEEEKPVARELVVVALDNPLLDVEAAIERIRTLKIVYPEDATSAREAMPSLPGADAMYYDRTNTIVYPIQAREGDHDEIYWSMANSTFAHEMGHLIYPCSKLPRYIAEGVACSVDAEYIQKDRAYYDGNYHRELSALRALTYLVGRDVMLEAISSNDLSPIVDAMAQIQGDEESARETVENLCPMAQYGEDTSRSPESLEAVLGPYFDAKNGSGWSADDAILTNLDRIFWMGRAYPGAPAWMGIGEIEGAWPDRYYLRSDSANLE